MIFEHLRRGGHYYRVASPDWDDPLDGVAAMPKGARWHAPGAFPVVYLNATRELARLFVLHRLRGFPYGPEDLDPDAAPVLVTADIAEDDFVDVVSEGGCVAAGLPATYPFHPDGRPVTAEECRPVGQAAWDGGEPGIACRSASTGARLSDEELAWFQRETRLTAVTIERFPDWYWPRQ